MKGSEGNTASAWRGLSKILRVRFLIKANLSKGRDAKLPVFGFDEFRLIKAMTAEPPEVKCLSMSALGTRKRCHFSPPASTVHLIDAAGRFGLVRMWFWMLKMIRLMTNTRILAVGLSLLIAATGAIAGPREQAKRMHDRLAGVPPTEAVLDSMEVLMATNPLAAADIALANDAFYSVTLKNFASPWTNRDGNVFVPLNDYTALVVGMIRDDEPFNELLSTDLLYVGDPSLGLPAYAMTNNDHFAQMEATGVSLKTGLVPASQSSMTDLPLAATAGVVTTRAAAEAFFIAGTNRAMFRFTLLNHLCNDMEQVLDTSLPADRIRQDVSRSPGGDSRVFLNNCIGCHSGMDPLAQAYAHYTFDETLARIVYDNTQVHPKYFNNDANFEFGYVTPDDSWENRWREGQNAALGWDPGRPGNGNGAKSMGEELANSDAFAQCQVKKVFRNVCLREPVNQADRDQVQSMVTTFKSNYLMKPVFAESAVYCKGD